MLHPNKTLGGILLIISAITTVNIFKFSIISSSVGFILAAFLLIAIWALTTTTALLVLEIALNFKEGANGFSSIAAKTLGGTGKVMVAACFLLFFYALLASYFAGLIALPQIKIYELHLPHFLNTAFPILIIGGALVYGTKAVDLCNRGLITIKGLCLLMIFVFLLPKTSVNLVPHIRDDDFNWMLYLNTTVFLLLSTFKFHIVIPRLCDYLEAKPCELRRCILVGSGASLIISLFLLLVGRTYLVGMISNKWLSCGVNGFHNIALGTSFLLISVGLFDFVIDGFKLKHSKLGKLQAVFLTFVPPLIFSVFYPQGFLEVLKYAPFFAATLLIILPAIMVYRLRAVSDAHAPQVFGGKWLLITITILGGMLALFPCYQNFWL